MSEIHPLSKAKPQISKILEENFILGPTQHDLELLKIRPHLKQEFTPQKLIRKYLEKQDL